MGRRPASTSGLNLLVGIDKPAGMTSHDVVARVRRALHERRIGHAGTLDPLATGVMVLGVGQATRLLGFATAEDKEYLARVSFGHETTTDDAEGETRCEASTPEHVLDLAFAQDSMNLLLNMTQQVPPAYSAISVDGVRAYAAARRGEEVALDPRPIRVLSALALATGTDDDGAPFWDIIVHVSKGTYVRALARDLGRELGSACHLRQLRRTRSGSVSLSQCVSLDELEYLGVQALRPLDPAAVLGLRTRALSERESAAVRNGTPVDCGVLANAREGERVALVSGGLLRAVATVRRGRLEPAAVFPDGIDGMNDEG
ncbi:MAG: tRNA pseudouridine(55) synthase TruB [Coriobacteriia bacterium]|nr:tRNA pseudouridine(55) synthase TruB [Coriobacteriia bacterium]MBS5478978.1 tRNA pseudouridine(55) synthase TruB [Coriobacteriia bacterium]